MNVQVHVGEYFYMSVPVYKCMCVCVCVCIYEQMCARIRVSIGDVLTDVLRTQLRARPGDLLVSYTLLTHCDKLLSVYLCLDE